MTRRLGPALLLVCLLGPGCAVKQIAFTHSLSEDLDDLKGDLDLLPPFPEPLAESGSLWTTAGPGAAMIRDTRAFRINDLVTIQLQESSQGSNASNTDLSRTSNTNFMAPYTFGLTNLDRVLEEDSTTDFSGDGTTTRSSSLVGSITARVMRVLPNADLIIAGQKTVMVNRERQILTLVGSIRPVDVSARNRVGSSSVGDLTVRMWGTGEINDTIRQGWFMRIMNRIWPF